MSSPSGIPSRPETSLRSLRAFPGWIAFVLTLGSGVASADCPTQVRVPEDAASINAAAAMICAGTTAEIVVGPGVWPASIATAQWTEVTVRGAGVGVTIIVPTSAGGPFVVNPQYPGTNRVSFAQATLQGGGGFNWRASFDHCRVEGSAANFFSDGRTVSDTAFVACNGGWYSTIYEDGDASIERCTFVACDEPVLLWGDGGGAGHIIRDCSFTDCASACVVIKCSCCSIGANHAIVERCSFTNTAGRAIRFDAFQASGAQTPVLEVIDSQFTGNHTTGKGGAILIGVATTDYPAAQSSTTVTGCTFTGNSAIEGGAIYTKNNQPITLTGCTFEANTATNSDGGAVAQEFEGFFQSLTATGCLFTGNSAIRGGAVSVHGWSGTTTLTNCTFEDNVSELGGAFTADRQNLQITGCTFDGNSATNPGGDGGGAIHTFMTGGLIRTSTFRNNHALGRGGAAHFYYYCTTAMEDCVFESNSAGSMGGAIAFQDRCSQSITRCTFRENQSATNGAAIAFFWHSPGKPSRVTDCSFSYGPSSTPSVAVMVAEHPVELSGSTFCGSGLLAFTGPIVELAPSCVTASCADSDGDGAPDGCEVVTVPGDYATIQTAIESTAAGDFRIVSVAAGTYAGPIVFGGKSVVVRGAGADSTIIDGSGGAESAVVRFSGGEPATAALEGVTIRGGQGGSPFPTNPAVLVGGGVFGYNSAASIRNCVIEQNVGGFGGGAYMFGCTGRIEQCTIRDNDAIGDGGGLQLYGGAVTVVDCSITGNYANSRGGGVHAVEGQPDFTRVVVTGNSSNNVVGGLSWVPQGNESSYLVLTDCTVTGNSAEKLMGGIGIVNDDGGAKMQLVGTQVCSNLPPPNISGPYLADSASEVCDCVGDVIVDGVVNGIDLSALLVTWGTDGGTTPRADCNHDGIVDGFDMGIMLGSWGNCAP